MINSSQISKLNIFIFLFRKNPKACALNANEIWILEKEWNMTVHMENVGFLIFWDFCLNLFQSSVYDCL